MILTDGGGIFAGGDGQGRRHDRGERHQAESADPGGGRQRQRARLRAVRQHAARRRELAAESHSHRPRHRSRPGRLRTGRSLLHLLFHPLNHLTIFTILLFSDAIKTTQILLKYYLNTTKILLRYYYDTTEKLKYQ